MKDVINTKLREIFESTPESEEMLYIGELDNIDYYSLFCKAASKNKLYKLFGNDVCAFNYKNDDCDSVLFLFFIPINSEECGSKNIAEKIMDIVKKTEECFITLDYVVSTEIKEDKFIYVTIVKNITTN